MRTVAAVRFFLHFLQNDKFCIDGMSFWSYNINILTIRRYL